VKRETRSLIVPGLTKIITGFWNLNRIKFIVDRFFGFKPSTLVFKKVLLSALTPDDYGIQTGRIGRA